MHSHQKHRNAGARRARQFMAECGGHVPHKRSGGAVGHRGNNSEAVMRRGSAEASDTYVEGVKNSHRIPKAKGGKVRPPVVNVDAGKHLHIHLSHPPLGAQDAASAMMPPQGTPMAGPPPGAAAGHPIAGAMVPGRPGMQRGGATTGINRLDEFHRLRGKG
jgi:hypothetical protein